MESEGYVFNPCSLSKVKPKLSGLGWFLERFQDSGTD